MKKDTISFVFVDAIPEVLEEHTLYVAMEFATAVHKCVCGCGQEVVTPLSTTDWKITYDGFSVSLWPSIGNWSFPCQSHYWIVRNEIRWEPQRSPKRIAAGRADDKSFKQGHNELTAQTLYSPTKSVSQGFLTRLWLWFRNP